MDNYHELHNFKTSGLGQAQWPRLIAIPASEVEDFYKQNEGQAY